LVKHIVEGKIEGIRLVTGGQRRRRKLLSGNGKEKRGYCKLKEEALVLSFLYRESFQHME